MKEHIINKALLIFGLLIISCNNVNKKTNNQLSNKKVTIYDYQIRLSDLNKKELRDSIKVNIDTLNYNNRKNIIYSESFKKDSTYRYSYSIERDSFFFFDEHCKNLDTVFLNYKGDTIEIIKSIYDVKNSIDEECHIYWSKKYGLISAYNYPWGGLILFDNDEIVGFAKETFYNYIVSMEKEHKMRFIKKTN